MIFIPHHDLSEWRHYVFAMSMWGVFGVGWAGVISRGVTFPCDAFSCRMIVILDEREGLYLLQT